MEFIHEPVLLQEVLEWMDVKPNGVYCDGTLGGGGHSGARLIGTVDLGNHNRTGANVQRLIDPDIHPTGNADYGADPRHIGSANQILQIFKSTGAMLHIQQYKVVSGIASRFHKRRVRGNHKWPESTLFRVQRLSENFNITRARKGIIVHALHLLSLFVAIAASR